MLQVTSQEVVDVLGVSMANSIAVFGSSALERPAAWLAGKTTAVRRVHRVNLNLKRILELHRLFGRTGMHESAQADGVART